MSIKQDQPSSPRSAASTACSERVDVRPCGWRIAPWLLAFSRLHILAAFQLPSGGERIGFAQPSSKIDLLTTLAAKRPKLKVAGVEQPLAGWTMSSRHKRSHPN
jgi:hypothetical protein